MCYRGFLYPSGCQVSWNGEFSGPIIHTARWDHNVNYEGKRIAVIGTGCSAVQVIPPLAEKAATVKQYARSGQWFHDRPNRMYTDLDKALYRYVPFYQKWQRLQIFLDADEETTAYFPGRKGLSYVFAIDRPFPFACPTQIHQIPGGPGYRASTEDPHRKPDHPICMGKLDSCQGKLIDFAHSPSPLSSNTT